MGTSLTIPLAVWFPFALRPRQGVSPRCVTASGRPFLVALPMTGRLMATIHLTAITSGKLASAWCLPCHSRWCHPITRLLGAPSPDSGPTSPFQSQWVCRANMTALHPRGGASPPVLPICRAESPGNQKCQNTLRKGNLFHDDLSSGKPCPHLPGRGTGEKRTGKKRRLLALTHVPAV